MGVKHIKLLDNKNTLAVAVKLSVGVEQRMWTGVVTHSAALSAKLRKSTASWPDRTMSSEDCQACLSVAAACASAAALVIAAWGSEIPSYAPGSVAGSRAGDGWSENPPSAWAASVAKRSSHRVDARSADSNSEATVSGECPHC